MEMIFVSCIVALKALKVGHDNEIGLGEMQITSDLF